MNTSDNVTQNWIILRHIKALNKGHGDEPEKSWKHDGSSQPSCCHPGWKIRSQMVLVVTRIKIVTGGGADALQTLSVFLLQGSMYVWN